MIDLIGERFDAALRISALTDSSFLARRLAPVQLLVAAAAGLLEKARQTEASRRSREPRLFSLREPAQRHQLAIHQGQRIRPGPHRWTAVRQQRRGGNAVDARGALRVALLPDFMLWRDVEAGLLEVALTDWTAPELTLHLLTAHGRAQPRRLRAFSDFVHERYGGGHAPLAGLRQSPIFKSWGREKAFGLETGRRRFSGVRNSGEAS